jgi:predicted kinase
MMQANKLKSPVVIYFYGIPGSGKSYLAHQLSDYIGAAHVSADRLRYELFDESRHDKTEHQIISQLMNYMTEEFIKKGVSVIYDMSVSRSIDRKSLRELSKKLHAKELLIWLQIDIDTAWARTKKRDKRKFEDKYACDLTAEQFKQYVRIMQNPNNEDYLVISGKHQFKTQKNTILRRLHDMNALNVEALNPHMPRPELTNLVSRAQAQAGRVDLTRRNISIQ